MKPQVMRQAPDAESAADSATESSKRKQVSKRDFLDANGSPGTDKESVRIEDAKGARYALLGGAGGTINLDYVFGQNPEFDRMCALFGYHTKIGNVANTVLNDKDEPGTPDDAAAEIRAWLTKAQATPPVWAERSTGVAGSRIDKDALAGAIIAVLQAGGGQKWQDAVAAAGGDAQKAAGDLYQKVRDRLESDAAYVRSARQVGDVAAEYARRVGNSAKTVDELL